MSPIAKMSEVCYACLSQAAEPPDLILQRTCVKEGFIVKNPCMVDGIILGCGVFPRENDCITPLKPPRNPNAK